MALLIAIDFVDTSMSTVRGDVPDARPNASSDLDNGTRTGRIAWRGTCAVAVLAEATQPL